jgi:hypothetical protein
MATNHLPSSQRSLIGKIGANTRWAKMTKDERRAATAAATKGREKSWERQADPEGRMTPAELIEAVARLKKAHYSLMALRSAQARASRKAARSAE